MFQFPGACCNSEHVDVETRDLLYLSEELVSWVRFNLVLEWLDDEAQGLFENLEFAVSAWKAKNCPACTYFNRPALTAPPAALATELEEARRLLYDLCPLPAAARLDGAPARYTHDPADRHASTVLHTPHPDEDSITLAGMGGELIYRHPVDDLADIIAHSRPVPLPAPLRLMLEEWEDSKDLEL